MKRQSPFGETIFALSTGRLPSGVAVVRVSGNRVTDVVKCLCGGIPPARKAVLRTFTDRKGVKIDQGLIVFFPGPQSFTGEDCAEFHLHGGRAVVSALLGELGSSDGLRGAESGEFTMRAFFNGKIDLTGAEALSDLIAAETETQRRMAIENAGGRQSALYESWRTRIIHAQAMIEAELDFSDEEDVPGSVAAQTWSEIAALIGEIKAHAGEYHRAEIIRDGFKVAIIGAPNVGKSTLLNALARRDVAIVSDEPGTTRDVISVTLDLGGIAVVISDTAGIRAQPDTIEALGIERSFSTAREADLILLLRCNGQDQQLGEPADAGKTLRVVTKSDLDNSRSGRETGELLLSSKTGEGIDRLLIEIEEMARNTIGGPLDTLPSRQRHIDDLNAAAEFLTEAGDDRSGGLEIRAEALRLAANRLGRLTGHVDVEDVLDVVFGTFCIGK